METKPLELEFHSGVIWGAFCWKLIDNDIESLLHSSGLFILQRTKIQNSLIKLLFPQIMKNFMGRSGF